MRSRDLTPTPATADKTVDNLKSAMFGGPASLVATLPLLPDWARLSRWAPFDGKQPPMTPMRTHAIALKRKRDRDGVALTDCASGEELLRKRARGELWPFPLLQRGGSFTPAQYPPPPWLRKLRGARLDLLSWLVLVVVVMRRRGLVAKHAELGELTGLRERRAREIVFDLREAGLVVQSPTYDRFGAVESQRANVYRITKLAAYTFDLPGVDHRALPDHDPDVRPRVRAPGGRPGIARAQDRHKTAGHSGKYPGDSENSGLDLATLSAREDAPPEIDVPATRGPFPAGSDSTPSLPLELSSASQGPSAVPPADVCETAVPSALVLPPPHEGLPGGSGGEGSKTETATRRIGDELGGILHGGRVVEQRRVNPDDDDALERRRRGGEKYQEISDRIDERHGERRRAVVLDDVERIERRGRRSPDDAPTHVPALVQQDAEELRRYREDLERERATRVNLPSPPKKTDDDADLFAAIERAMTSHGRGELAPVHARMLDEARRGVHDPKKPGGNGGGAS